jgi:hypothetical protein
MQIRVISQHATAILDLPGAGPGIMSDAQMMSTAMVTAYVGGAVPPAAGREFVALPSMEFKLKNAKKTKT